MEYEPIGGIKSDHVRYRPSSEDIELIRKACPHYYEVWEGLPDVDFKETTDRAGRTALKFDTDSHYIWVPSDSTEAYRSDGNTLFFVFMNTGSKDKIRAWWVNAGDGDVDYLIEKAKRANEEKILDGRRIAYDEEARIEAERSRRLQEHERDEAYRRSTSSRNRDEELRKQKEDRGRKKKMDKWW